jgi:hypothetical protein
LLVGTLQIASLKDVKVEAHLGGQMRSWIFPTQEPHHLRYSIVDHPRGSTQHAKFERVRSTPLVVAHFSLIVVFVFVFLIALILLYGARGRGRIPSEWQRTTGSILVCKLQMCAQPYGRGGSCSGSGGCG